MLRTHRSHDRHAGHSVAMFRDKFWLTLILTLPVVAWSGEVLHWLGYTAPTFPGSQYIPALLGTIVFLYGGSVFIRGAWGELAGGRLFEWNRHQRLRYRCLFRAIACEKCERFAVSCYGPLQTVERRRVFRCSASCYLGLRRQFEHSFYGLTCMTRNRVPHGPGLLITVVQLSSSCR